MIQKILSTFIMVVFVIGGGVAGDMVKTKSVDKSAAEGEAKPKKDKAKKDDKKKEKKSKDKSSKDKKSKDKKGKKDKGKKGKDAKGKDKVYGAGPQYLEFKRHFVVPVMDHDKIQALVVMNINVELTEDAPGDPHGYAPRLRDAFMRELLALSNSGHFGANMTSPKTYQLIRERLNEAAIAIIPEGVGDVLILDIARQES